MRILVTGGAGFIGGHLAERFVREGQRGTHRNRQYDVEIDRFGRLRTQNSV